MDLQIVNLTDDQIYFVIQGLSPRIRRAIQPILAQKFIRERGAMRGNRERLLWKGSRRENLRRVPMNLC